MSDTETIHSWEQLSGLIAQRDAAGIESFLRTLTPAETARTISRLDEEEQQQLLSLLSPAEAADMLRDLPEEQAADLIEEVSPSTAAAIVDLLPADEQADLLADVETEEAEAILDAMPGADAEQARTLLLYDEDTAGGLMTKEYLSYNEVVTVGDVLNDLQTNSEKYVEYQVQYAYITDSYRKLLGVIRMRDLLLSPHNRKVGSMIIRDPIHVTADTPLQRLVQVFDDHVFMGIPVVDAQQRLIGVLERTAVLDARTRQAKNSFLQISGIVGGEEFRSMPLLQRSFRRLSWLGPNIALNIIAASVIAAYQNTLQSAIALAVFLPIISDMSGCSGNQAVAVSIRELALGLIKPGEFARIFLKESGLGLINGLLLGILLGGVAYLWKQNLYLSLVIGTALFANTVLSVLLGGSVPLLLRKFRIDPALASGPILTTITDMCGFFLVLSLATMALNKLSM